MYVIVFCPNYQLYLKKKKPKMYIYIYIYMEEIINKINYLKMMVKKKHNMRFKN